MLSKILPPNHSVLSSIFNQMRIVLASNKKYELAITYIDKALDILAKTVGGKNILFVITRMNKALVSCLLTKQIQSGELDNLLLDLQSFLPENHHLKLSFNKETLHSVSENVLHHEHELAPSFIWVIGRNWYFKIWIL